MRPGSGGGKAAAAEQAHVSRLRSGKGGGTVTSATSMQSALHASKAQYTARRSQIRGSAGTAPPARPAAAMSESHPVAKEAIRSLRRSSTQEI